MMEQFIKYVLVLVGIYVAQTLFKVATTRKDGTFDLRKLINGTIDYAIYFCGIMVMFYAGSLISDIQIIPIGDKTYTITDALTALAYALIVMQSKKCFDNIKETFKVSDDDIDIKQFNDYDVDKNMKG
jgi:hypothetical protein